MGASDVVTLIGGTGGGVGVAMLVLFIIGQIVPKSRVDELKKERDEWKRTAELNAVRADSVVATGRIVRETMDALKSASRELT